MASSITAFRFQPVWHRSLGRDKADEALCMECPGGTVILTRSVLEDAGDSWQRVKERTKTVALEKNIPYSDET